jgi:hypothetical protein
MVLEQLNNISSRQEVQKKGRSPGKDKLAACQEEFKTDKSICQGELEP